MGAIQPELIELMKAVLDDAAATLPEAKRTTREAVAAWLDAAAPQMAHRSYAR